MRPLIQFAVIAAVCAGMGLPAAASESEAPVVESAGSPGTMDTIQNWLDQADDAIDGVTLWKFKIGVSFTERMIYDDNVYLNDDDEPNTEGRADSIISETSLGLSLLLPTNPDYSRLFKRDTVNILSYEATYLWYFNEPDTSNLAHSISTDLFGFFKDLFKLTGEGSRFYFRVQDTLDFKTDPLDLELKNLRLTGFPTLKSFDKLERWENRFHAMLGYDGNLFRARATYDNEFYAFEDDEFESADHMEHKVALRVTVDIPGMEDKAVYAEGRYRWLRYDEDVLNDAEAWEAVLGFDGIIISRKLRAIAEAGFLSWDSDDNGDTADEDDHEGGLGMVRLIFRPWEERKVQFQLEVRRELTWSAIANFRIDDTATFSVIYEWIPDKLELDLTLSAESHDESDGPDRILYEAGLGARYKLFRQVDVTARYLYRRQDSEKEIELVQDGETTSSDGDFYQNVFSLGLELRF
jgi:hypothetical protein